MVDWPCCFKPMARQKSHHGDSMGLRKITPRSVREEREDDRNCGPKILPLGHTF